MDCCLGPENPEWQPFLSSIPSWVVEKEDGPCASLFLQGKLLPRGPLLLMTGFVLELHYWKDRNPATLDGKHLALGQPGGPASNTQLQLRPWSAPPSRGRLFSSSWKGKWVASLPPSPEPLGSKAAPSAAAHVFANTWDISVFVSFVAWEPEQAIFSLSHN